MVIQDQIPTHHFQAGRNCWRIEESRRVSLLIDGETYFRAFRAAATRARRSIMILGWDFDSRTRIVIDHDPDGLPDQIGNFCQELLRRQHQLQIYVLTWDHHLIYSIEREWTSYANWLIPRRLHTVKDGAHPVGASHHQKVVVIDDALAFVGGLDFAPCRCDTPAHRINHLQRRLMDGKPCRPFHDIQIMVDGEAARALGELARARWEGATGELLFPSVLESVGDHWPCSVTPDLHHVPVAIARTQPSYENRKEIREVETLFTESIKLAHRFIYIETQYLTSQVIASALADRLRDPAGPEIVILLHPNSDGWLEHHTMDVLRGRVLKTLRADDRFHRLALYFPHLLGLDNECMTLHAKVCVIDDDFVRVGSANCSNRSMGFDTECDLAIESSGDAEIQRTIAGFRNRLLGEHLDVTSEQVADAFAREGSLIASIETLRGKPRTLRVFDEQIPADVEGWVPDAEYIDPIRPYESTLVLHASRRSVRRQLIIGASVLAGLLAVAAGWHWTPLGQLLNIPMLVGIAEQFKHSAVAPFLTLAAFVLGALMVVPVTAMIAVTVLAFGPILGFSYALVGMTVSALLTFWIGKLLGRHSIQRLAGSRLHQLSRRLAQKGVVAVVMIRLVPVAPFTIVNL
ncbi:MAG TPA: VTT domain-containing protein, partial [Nitrospiraceae bacterium]|nr:VTT domain-containing protein [Nitrospiraceae bacterium]